MCVVYQVVSMQCRYTYLYNVTIIVRHVVGGQLGTYFKRFFLFDFLFDFSENFFVFLIKSTIQQQLIGVGCMEVKKKNVFHNQLRNPKSKVTIQIYIGTNSIQRGDLLTSSCTKLYKKSLTFCNFVPSRYFLF